LHSVKLALPTRKLTNEDIVDLVRLHSRDTYSADVDGLLDHIRAFLKFTGAKTRYLLADGETPLQLVSKAVKSALAESGYDKNDIDLLVHCGVDRGFLEPGGSYFIAKSLGMDRVQCFDVIDACNSWARSAQIIQHLMRSGASKRVLLVNGEFNGRAGGPGYPTLFAVKSYEQLSWTFPVFTIGEAATATVFSSGSDEEEWCFHFSSRPDLADLCTIPLEGYEGYCDPSERVARNGALRFTSFGAELFEAARPELLNIFGRLNVPIDKVRAIFPHAASAALADSIARTLGVQHLVRNAYPRLGNVVSASVPAAMAMEIEEGRVQRGDLLVGMVASAGMSFSSFSFVY
jgi:3-oxoacyl-[acyl-carrier-protein] synthase III